MSYFLESSISIIAAILSFHSSADLIDKSINIRDPLYSKNLNLKLGLFMSLNMILISIELIFSFSLVPPDRPPMIAPVPPANTVPTNAPPTVRIVDFL